jgi:hypothetical protein
MGKKFKYSLSIVLISILLSIIYYKYSVPNMPIISNISETLSISNTVDVATYAAKSNKKIMNVGIGAYAIRSKYWKCDRFLAALDPLKEIHLAIVWDAFGEENDCLLTIMNDPRLKSLEIILINECCIRNGNCTWHEFAAGYSKREYEDAIKSKNKKLMRKFNRFAKKLQEFLLLNLKPWTTLYISPGLESNLSDDAMKVLIDKSRKIFPNAILVQNPLGKYGGSSYDAGGDVTEYHGTSLPNPWRPCITDLDGLDISFPERPSAADGSNWQDHIDAGDDLQDYIKRASKTCDMVFLWTWEMNCYDIGTISTANRIDPRERTCKGSGKVAKLIVDQVLLANSTKK